MRYALIVSILFIAACGAADSPADSYVVRDRAGIRIVENSGPAWSPGDAWQVSERPVLEIGVVSGDSMYQLYGVRQAFRLDNGTIVVANAGSSELRFYDSQGQFVRATGREGGGPGEFESLTGLYRFGGDSLLVYDAVSERVSVFDSRGLFVRDVSLAAAADGRSPPRVVGVLEDGTLIGQRALRAPREPNGYMRARLEIGLLVPGRRELGIGEFPGTEWERYVSREGNMFTTREASVLFSRSTSIANASGRVYIGTNDSYQVEVYSPEGTLAQIIRRTDAQPDPVTDAHIERWADYAIANMEQTVRYGPAPTPGEVRERLRARLRAPAVPAYEGLLVDNAGFLWVREYQMPWERKDPRTWSIFAADGRMLGSVTTPAGFRIFQVGEDFILGLVRDDLNVEHVRLLRLTRG